MFARIVPENKVKVSEKTKSNAQILVGWQLLMHQNKLDANCADCAFCIDHAFRIDRVLDRPCE